MSRSKRIIEVTAGLAVTGAVVGAVCAIGIILVLNAINGGIAGLFSADGAVFLAVVAFVGALFGLVAAPLLSWGLLRRVPLGKAILATGLGTMTGAVAGETFYPMNPYVGGVPAVILGGFAGFIVGGIVVRLVAVQRAGR